MVIKFIEVVAIFMCAFSGFIEARSRKMDMVGTFTVAFITAFGGGTLRDILLDKRPLFWVDHQEYAIMICVLSVVSTPIVRSFQKLAWERPMVIADAVGYGLFSVAGTAQALAAGTPVFIAAMMGVITGVCGGLLRDIICNEVPMVLRDGKPYAICSFIGCMLYIILERLGIGSDLALWPAALTICVLRLVTWTKDVRLD